MSKLGWYWYARPGDECAEVAWRVGRLASETAAPLRRAQRTGDVDGTYWERRFCGVPRSDRPTRAARAHAGGRPCPPVPSRGRGGRRGGRRVPLRPVRVLRAGAGRARPRRRSTGSSTRALASAGPPYPRRASTTAPCQRIRSGSGSSTGCSICRGWLRRGSSPATAATRTQRWTTSTDGSSRTRRGHGIAWRGAFEVGVRALSVTVALQGLRDAPSMTRERYAPGRARCSNECAPLALAAAFAVQLREQPPRRRDGRARRHRDPAPGARGSAAVGGEGPRGAGAGGRAADPAGRGGRRTVHAYQLFAPTCSSSRRRCCGCAGTGRPARSWTALRRGAHYLAAAPRQRRSAASLRRRRRRLRAAAAPDPVPGRRTATLQRWRAVHGETPAILLRRGSARPRPAPTSPAGRRAGAGACGPVLPDGGLVVLRRGDRRITVDVGPARVSVDRGARPCRRPERHPDRGVAAS